MQWQCGLMSQYFDHLLVVLIGLTVVYTALLDVADSGAVQSHIEVEQLKTVG